MFNIMKSVYYFFENLYYNIKWGLWAFWKYHKIVWKTRTWDYAYVLEMMKFQLVLLQDNIKRNSHSEKQCQDLARVIELLTNQIEDNYIERAGGLTKREVRFEEISINSELMYKMEDDRTKEEREKDAEIILRADALEKKEWSELWETIKSGNGIGDGMHSWWD